VAAFVSVARAAQPPAKVSSMSPERWGQLEELYQAARALPPSERSALLERADPELRATVAAMLAHEEDGAFLNRPAWQGCENLLNRDALQTEYSRPDDSAELLDQTTEIRSRIERMQIVPAGFSSSRRDPGTGLTPAAEPPPDRFATLVLPAHNRRESRRSAGRERPAPGFPDHWDGSGTETI